MAQSQIPSSQGQGPHTSMVKEAAYAWPPNSLPLSSTIAQEQRNWQIPPIHGVAEQLVQQAALNGVSGAPQNMYLPTFGFTLPPESKIVAPVWSQFPMTPDNPNKPMLGQYQLSPLSNGGFLYLHVPNQQLPPMSPQPMLSPPLTPPLTPPSSSDPVKMEEELTIKPSMVAQTRKDKIEKYRNKRSSRNWNRQADPSKKAVAQLRSRDEQGHFVSENGKFHEVVEQLALSQKESRELQQKLSAMERELAELRNRAVEARMNEANVKQELKRQQDLNRSLMDENQFLWKTVPQDEIFTTLNPDHAFVDREPFLNKVNLSDIDLILDSPEQHPEEWSKEENLLG